MNGRDTDNLERREKNRKYFHVFYLSMIFVLLVLSLTLSALDLGKVIKLHESPWRQIDNAVMLLFWIEYLVRFVIVKHKGEYFKENFIELISILPYSTEFGYLHLFRLLRFVRLIKFMHLPFGWRNKPLFRFMRRTRKRVAFFMNSRGFIYGLYGAVLLLFTTAFAVELVEHLSYPKAFLETTLACFTVGIGISPESTFGKVAAYLLAAALLGLVIWFIAAAISHRRRISRLKKCLFLSSDKRDQSAL